MKNIFSALLSACFGILLCACSVFNAAFDSPEISFAGLKTYYINPPQSGANVMQLWSVRASFNEMVVESIEQQLKQKGFERVSDKAAAQFYITPVYNEWYFENPLPNYLANDAIMTLGTDTGNTSYMTLELQAYLPDSASFVWRGFSDIRINSNSISIALAQNSVTWCLQTFPCEPLPESVKKAKSASSEVQKPAEQQKSAEPAKPEVKGQAETQKAA